jgi:hypothetical protein
VRKQRGKFETITETFSPDSLHCAPLTVLEQSPSGLKKKKEKERKKKKSRPGGKVSILHRVPFGVSCPHRPSGTHRCFKVWMEHRSASFISRLHRRLVHFSLKTHTKDPAGGEAVSKGGNSLFLSSVEVVHFTL